MSQSKAYDLLLFVGERLRNAGGRGAFDAHRRIVNQSIDGRESLQTVHQAIILAG